MLSNLVLICLCMSSIAKHWGNILIYLKISWLLNNSNSKFTRIFEANSLFFYSRIQSIVNAWLALNF